MMLVLVFILLLTIGTISLLSERLPANVLRLLSIVFVLAMVILSGMRPGSDVSDFSTYELMFEEYDSILFSTITEPTFSWIASLVHSMKGTIRGLIWIYALISIPLKIYAFQKIGGIHILLAALPLYLANFFQLHDCEQMRIAAALAFVILSYSLWIEHKTIHWLISWLIAILFHYSAAITIIPMLITRREDFSIQYRLGLIAIIGLGILVGWIGVNLFPQIPIEFVQTKMELYEQDINNGLHESLKVINMVVLLRIVLVCYVCYYYDTIRAHMQSINILLVCEVLGLFFWFAFQSVFVFATRCSEIFEACEALLFASVIYTVKPQYAGKIAILMIALYFFALAYIYNQFGFR